MSHGSLLPNRYTLNDLLDFWQRGMLTKEEVLQRWPMPDAVPEEVTHELLCQVLGLRARIAAIDSIGDW